MPSLLAVDLGLKTGLALYGRDGRLIWYRSRNFGTTSRLRRGVHVVLGETADLSHLVLEGGGALAVVWARVAERRGLTVRRTSADEWRHALLYPRQQRSGAEAKRHAAVMARRAIEWSGAARPTSLRHDAAEAILIGLWGVVDAGWLAEIPSALRP